MKVFLCEKPAQARDIARAVGQPERKEGFLQVGNTAFTWCVGHLYTQAEPVEYNPDFKRWNLDHLPIVPEVWRLKPRDRVRQQIHAIRGLLKQAEEVIIATDPDREGEVIGREVLDEMHYQGPVRRLLLNALDETSIRKSLNAICSGNKTVSLYYAGLGRSRADWLVGMNLTRAWTLISQARGSSGVTSIGRVQTPTLNLIVQRDLNIEKFTPSDYFTVEAECQHGQAKAFVAYWKPNQNQRDQFCDREGRCMQKFEAERIAQQLQAEAGANVTESESQHKRIKAPLPFALSDLQQLGNKRWGYGAKQVLEIAQELYEKHKVISYPRSDSGYLPEDQFAEASKVIAGLRNSFGSNEYMYLFDGLDMARKSRAWNDAKVTAHHGIVPTMQLVQINSLGEPERNIYRVIAERYLMQFLPDHEYESVKLKLDAGGVNLEASGKQTMIGGWKALEQSEAERVDPPIPYLDKGETLVINDATVMDRQTKPPARYTEGTLIKGMTRIAAEVENPDIRAILREHDGIGTEATRAEIIQTLKNRGFIEVRKKSLYSTPKGRELIAAIPKELTDPSTTAVMERLLSEVEAGKTSLAQFMAQQQELVNNWISNAKEALRASDSQPSESSRIPSAPQSEQNLGNCPDCDSPLARRRGKYGVFVGCSNYPDCRYIRKGKNGATQQKTQFSTEKICIQCGSPMVVRNGKRGPFLGCSGYPKCRHTAQMKD